MAAPREDFVLPPRWSLGAPPTHGSSAGSSASLPPNWAPCSNESLLPQPWHPGSSTSLWLLCQLPQSCATPASPTPSHHTSKHGWSGSWPRIPWLGVVLTLTSRCCRSGYKMENTGTVCRNGHSLASLSCQVVCSKWSQSLGRSVPRNTRLKLGGWNSLGVSSWSLWP